MSVTKEQVKEFLGKMTVLDMAGLIKELESEWGVTAAAPVAVAAAAPVAAAAAPVEEKTEFDVILESVVPEKKINVIKEIRPITNLGLKEAKELVEKAPTTVKQGVSKEEAEDIKKKLEAAGGTVKVK